MATPETISDQQEVKKEVYSVWAIPPDEVGARLRKLMEGLRAEFNGPQFEPHITVVGAIRLTPDDALAKFRSACEGLRAYNASVDRVATAEFDYDEEENYKRKYMPEKCFLKFNRKRESLQNYRKETYGPLGGALKIVLFWE
ncbi:Cyclic phosphodiesterase [Morus notabilis]|uniref:Cyclic phosphodiesterase n=1 Tax=Morus notabilis TaxID=981085 RepID=W9QQY5_9ROSA|nr:Cyclic phosphodiesterase [Morus notabilis]